MIVDARSYFSLFLCCILFCACKPSSPPSEFTGKESSYVLSSRSNHSIRGTALFQEKKTGEILITLTLQGIKDGFGLQFPAHLHHGDIENAQHVAVILTSVDGETGISVTEFSTLSDIHENETEITYQSLVALEVCIRVHLGSSDEDKKIVLAGDNVGNWALNVK